MNTEQDSNHISEGASRDRRANGDQSGEFAGYRRLIDLGIALSAEHDHDRLMERILLEAKDFTHADAGTLYLKTEADTLCFQILRNDTLDIAMGGTTGVAIDFPEVMLLDDSGEPNMHNVASAAANSGDTINIADAYTSSRYDFSGTKAFDERSGYRSTSFLTVPLKNHEGMVIGVMQLLNARDRKTGDVIAFDPEIEPLIDALASQAAVSLDNEMLLEAQKQLLDAFIELIAGAIDAKSPYTGGHCQRVPELTKMLARAACDQTDGPFKDFELTEDEWYELHIAGWLHDCGKVTTPEYVVDKATKLETIYDRIHEVRMRFEVLKRDAEIEYLRARLDGGNHAKLKAGLDAKLAALDDDYEFIAECNVGGEFMADDRIERAREIANREWTRTISDRIGISYDEARRKEREPEAKLPVAEKLLADRADHIIERETQDLIAPDNRWGFNMRVPERKYNLGEVYNLCVGRGTLTDEDRFKINEHMIQTIKMLESLPFPRNLKRVPEYAGGHHEKMDGTGYPRGLSEVDMSVPARIMAIADIFEALTAADRPYKAPKKLSESVKIMGFMEKDAHIDGELFRLFLQSGVYKEYGKRFLKREQIDEVDVASYLQAAE
ncbi:MAG: HD domain-containing phosphohydrolase [Rhodospirillales bacterium]|jgi:HD-GYP domain-containing protein (c-di-GMP phosphodiesterase class II)|nr:diguanylate cyclase [Rhodospirillaceae bacterium]MDP6427811.1 HD domain-containing phosphohydrolase [Rhodospirillales bacterium]MDP6644555.1 HD domain-containing phosphohydrolase [Rhodospirillales bacterium]MDP6840311.1 HD domain-containing phosphohydrolase [Rhodospirillales bacterium]|tara:strand:+ start:478 stop:2310 length:1833 start_codon:yes stop_codon:yes gene_type:complete